MVRPCDQNSNAANGTKYFVINGKLTRVDFNRKYSQQSYHGSRSHSRYYSKHRQYCKRMDYYGRFDLASAVLPNLSLLGTAKFARIASPFCDIKFNDIFAKQFDSSIVSSRVSVKRSSANRKTQTGKYRIVKICRQYPLSSGLPGCE